MGEPPREMQPRRELSEGTLKAKRVKNDSRVVETRPKREDIQELGVMGLKEWLEAHQVKLMVGVATVFVLLLVVWAVRSYGERKERSAQAGYAAILKDWPSDESGDATVWVGLQARLEKFISEEGATRAALLAQMDLLRVLLKQARLDEAIRVAGALASRVDGDATLRPLLRYQLALTYDAAGKSEEAMAQWNGLKAEPLPGVERQVDWALGRHHAARGDFGKAVELYESALKRSGDYPSSQRLQEDLAAVKAKASKES